MLENLTTTAENVKNADDVSAHPDKIREQLDENKVGFFCVRIAVIFLWVNIRSGYQKKCQLHLTIYKL